MQGTWLSPLTHLLVRCPSLTWRRTRSVGVSASIGWFDHSETCGSYPDSALGVSGPCMCIFSRLLTPLSLTGGYSQITSGDCIVGPLFFNQRCGCIRLDFDVHVDFSKHRGCCVLDASLTWASRAADHPAIGASSVCASTLLFLRLR